VDILFETSTGNPYISEVNAPCDFAGTQKKTGKDIAGILIDHLIQKVTKAQ
jgi:glutathione synthase/RimK-type ligase-like ATP-grasp enzyme